MQARSLLENLTGLNSHSEFQLLMAKEFIRRTLESDLSEPNGVTTAAMAYLAALHLPHQNINKQSGCAQQYSQMRLLKRKRKH